MKLRKLVCYSFVETLFFLLIFIHGLVLTIIWYELLLNCVIILKRHRLKLYEHFIATVSLHVKSGFVCTGILHYSIFFLISVLLFLTFKVRSHFLFSISRGPFYKLIC